MTIKKVLYTKEASMVPIKLWTDNIEAEAEAQLINVSTLPFVFHHVAAMPDVHAGYGATIGSVIATRGAVIPAAVGVDIGCGMMAVDTGLAAEDLPSKLSDLRLGIESAVPHGRTGNGGPEDEGAWPADSVPGDIWSWWDTHSMPLYQVTEQRRPSILERVNSYRHLGTLGTGNHFIEICLDEREHVWAVVHSGSRGIGNRIGMYFTKRAKENMKKWFIELDAPDLAYLVEGTQDCDDYLTLAAWAQRFAHANRVFMMRRILEVLSQHVGRSVHMTPENTIDCHHNYIEKENHFKSNVWVTRKGAIRARKGDLGIIPGSMGARSYIVEGLGNPDSFCSAAHGAGRLMSRTRARALFHVDDLITQTEGIECRKDESILDEIPAAYKDIDEVMENQKDLVSIKHELRQVINIKG